MLFRSEPRPIEASGLCKRRHLDWRREITKGRRTSKHDGIRSLRSGLVVMGERLDYEVGAAYDLSQRDEAKIAHFQRVRPRFRKRFAQVGIHACRSWFAEFAGGIAVSEPR